MNDMSSIITPRSDQINADELQNGQKLVITITDVMIRGGQEQPVAMKLAGMDKVYRPCKSMCRVLVAAWGLDAKEYVGRSLELYTDPTVKFGPLAVGGLRISRMSHIDGEMQMALTATKGVKKAYKVRPLVVERKADKVADGVSALLARIADGEDVAAEPAVIKQRAWLAENRPELAAQIDAALGANPFEEGPADEQRGESHTFSIEEWIERITEAPDLDTAGTAKNAAIAEHGNDQRFHVAMTDWKGARK